MYKLIIILLGISLGVSAKTEQYKCIDVDGSIHYKSMPCEQKSLATFSLHNEIKQERVKNKKSRKKKRVAKINKINRISESIIKNNARHDKLCLKLETNILAWEEKMSDPHEDQSQLAKDLQLAKNHYKRFCQ